jgi:hypothetical protein
LSQCASEHRIAGDYFALVHGQLTINDTTSCLVNRWDESALKIAQRFNAGSVRIGFYFPESRRGTTEIALVPSVAYATMLLSFVPDGDSRFFIDRNPALKRWAIIGLANAL